MSHLLKDSISVIICSAFEEAQIIIQHIKGFKLELFHEYIMIYGSVERKDVLLIIIGIGKTLSGHLLNSLTDKYNIKVIVNFGTAGAISKNYQNGMVVIVDESSVGRVDNKSIKWLYTKNKNKYYRWCINENKKKKFKTPLAIGKIISTNKFLNYRDKKIYNNLMENLCVNMECYNIAKICILISIPFLGIFSITDSFKENFESYEKNMKQVLLNGYELLGYLLKKY